VFCGALEGYSARVASYKDASATPKPHHNSSIVNHYYYASLLLFTMEYLCVCFVK
jgi:hypothetical protein